MSASVDETELNNALKRTLFEHSVPSWYVGMLTAVLCAFFLYGSVSTPGLISWFVVSLFIGVLRLPIIFKAKQHAKQEISAVPYTVLTGLSGLIWSSLALFWSNQLDFAEQLVLLLVPLTLSLGGIISFGAWRSTCQIFLICTQIPLMLILLVLGDEGIIQIISPLLFFLCASLFISHRFFRQHIETHSLRVRNQRLLNDFAHQNESLKLARDDAQDACQVKDEFLARMSHELRTPMNGVLGVSQLLSNTSLDPQQNEMITILRQSGEGMLVLIDNLLDASSLVLGEIDLENRPYSIAQILKSIEAQSAETVSEKNLAWKLEIDAKVPDRLVGDERRIRQVLSALIDNALKFTQHGSVSVQISRTKSATSSSDNADSAEQLLLVVKDTGSGIETSELQLVSECFYQSHGDAKRRFGGSGLGLSIAKSLIELMGGTLTISSEVGKGTSVSVCIPLQIDTSRQAEELASVLAAQTQTVATVGKRVLVVEDNPINQMVIEAMLEDLTCEVTVAENGLVALSELESRNFDIVFMDCQMPELDGYGATIQAREKGYLLPIVAVTANSMAGDRQKCLSVGMDDYVSKPFTAETIARMLEKWTGTTGLQLAV